jgi:hypothetical protein
VVAGETISFLALSRADAIHVQIGFHAPNLEDLADVEAKASACDGFILAKAFGVSEADGLAWRETTDGEVVEKVIDAILKLSGIGPNGASPPQ